MSTAGDFLCVTGFDGRFRAMSASWRTSLGYHLAELGRRLFYDVVHADDLDAVMRAYRDLAAGYTCTNLHFRVRHDNGEYRCLMWTAIAVREAGLLFSTGREVSSHDVGVTR